MRDHCPFERMGNTPLFCKENGQPVDRASFLKLLNRLITRLLRDKGLEISPDRFSGHSMRAGGATSLAMRNVPSEIIQILGRWKSDSYRRYISVPLATLRGAARTLAVVNNHTFRTEVEECSSHLRLSDVGVARLWGNP